MIPVEVQGIGWRYLEGSYVRLRQQVHGLHVDGHDRRHGALHGPGHRACRAAHPRSDPHRIRSPYRNMQQSPAPDRPQFKLTFNITPGDPVLPPPVSEQAQKAVRMLPPQGELVATPAVLRDRAAGRPSRARASSRARLSSCTGTPYRQPHQQRRGARSVKSRMAAGNGDRSDNAPSRLGSAAAGRRSEG